MPTSIYERLFRLLPVFGGALFIAWAVQAVAVWMTARVHAVMGVLP